MVNIKQHGHGKIWKAVAGFSFFNISLRGGKDAVWGNVNKMWHVASWLLWTKNTNNP